MIDMVYCNYIFDINKIHLFLALFSRNIKHLKLKRERH